MASAKQTFYSILLQLSNFTFSLLPCPSPISLQPSFLVLEIISEPALNWVETGNVTSLKLFQCLADLL